MSYAVIEKKTFYRVTIGCMDLDPFMQEKIEEYFQEKMGNCDLEWDWFCFYLSYDADSLEEAEKVQTIFGEIKTIEWFKSVD
ncbi:hypothetical protein AXI64_gp033 [Vibrio phage qdvp001]|uniref:hypothetical protein n=1 Tax=Vibrio phage qdvp001 TaxID=1003177 RepID=UPI00071F4EBC|nr:hypothetical protein AXI64_gp033 [Vibrio phage qdvp001]ALM62025.1 hypothetical protein qdvp001_033 [Vibrio phage qdvp001]